MCFCGLRTLTHEARGSHIACGVTIADRIRFREFVVLTSVFVPKAASKPLRGPRAALGAASADKDTCNELCESLPGCQRGPVPHTRFGFPPATPGGSGARPLPRRHGAPFRGRGPEAGGDRRPFTVKSCPSCSSLSFHDGRSKLGPRAPRGPLGRSRDVFTALVLSSTHPAPSSRGSRLGSRRTATQERQTAAHEDLRMPVEIQSCSCQRKVWLRETFEPSRRQRLPRSPLRKKSRTPGCLAYPVGFSRSCDSRLISHSSPLSFCRFLPLSVRPSKLV